ncbi:MAG: TetR/AcrR family transcriptional regulator [Inquilinaceae bacterium]
MVKKSDPSERIAAAALDLIAERGWRRLTMSDLADGAKVSLAELYALYPTRSSLLGGIAHMVDREVLAARSVDSDDSPRDRLFDVLMRRFDVLAAHRAGFLALLRDLRLDPCFALQQLPSLDRSMRWMLEDAGISSRGPVGAVRVRVLSALYLSVLRVWVNDDSPDMAHTMKILDSRLAMAEQLANTFERSGGSGGPVSSAESKDV